MTVWQLIEVLSLLSEEDKRKMICVYDVDRCAEMEIDSIDSAWGNRIRINTISE